MIRIFDFLKRNIEWVLIISIIFSFASPILFTRDWTGIDFTQTGNIGDTIGGLVSPILNLLSIILLYLTLREQTESSRKQKDFDSITNLLNTIKTDFENIQLYRSQETTYSYTGTRAIFEMSATLKTCDDITTCFDESSLRAFNLSFSFLVSNVSRLLQKNKNSYVDLEDKKEVYDTLKKFKNPIDMICNSSGLYIKNRKDKGNEIRDVDKIILMMYTIQKLLEKEYTDNEPK
ncbi:hypothetical protein [Flavobacterium wongokense]|uniref:hypothetical protein n=1 Tax=Flavobacterium wongokense TaxID=2910674 RepID=UPI001F3B0447|nr:hypothetical protein [Flavobacterium sp. WG47]MCF6133449.1 hypothetical protein [Flavobacterium sp. WG47]